jgi:hypothetical protein
VKSDLATPDNLNHIPTPFQSLGGVFAFQGPLMTTDNLTPNALRKLDAQSRAEALADVILPLRASGHSLRQIAAHLTATAVPTANGGAWGPKQVRDILERLDAPTEAQPASRDPLAALVVPKRAPLPADVDPLAVLPPPQLQSA